MDKVAIIMVDMIQLVADATNWLRRLRLGRKAFRVSGAPMDDLLRDFERWRASCPETGRALRLAAQKPVLPPMTIASARQRFRAIA